MALRSVPIAEDPEKIDIQVYYFTRFEHPPSMP